jgi:predicted transposase/invertase (TIGR01784 family)
MTSEQYDFYQDSLLTYIEVKEVVKTANNDGNEQGRQDREIEIARDLKKLGVAVDIIMKSTGLSEEEINEL